MDVLISLVYEIYERKFTTANWKNGYGFIGMKNGEYEYRYDGKAWMYSVLNNTTTQDTDDLYMNQFVLKSGMTVVLDYKVQTTTWTMAKPYTPNYPYLPA